MLEAIHLELENRKTYLGGEKVDTIYFGGGTPSVLEVREIAAILDKIYDLFEVNEGAEITLEANPDDLSEQKVMELAASSINRFSIGIQSFFDEDLSYMNRAHNAHEAMECVRLVQKHGFENITIDLIYGIPRQTDEQWEENLAKAFELGVPHISAYALTVEEGTALSHFISQKKYKPVDDVHAGRQFDILVNRTKAQGFVQYEVSNFGKPDYFSRHNSSYWKGLKYLGVGPSAHSFNGEERQWNIANNALYIKMMNQNEKWYETEDLSEIDRFNEALMIGLRTIWGVDLNQLKRSFPEHWVSEMLGEAEVHLRSGKLKLSDDKLLITDSGRFYADGIASDLFRLEP